MTKHLICVSNIFGRPSSVRVAYPRKWHLGHNTGTLMKCLNQRSLTVKRKKSLKRPTENERNLAMRYRCQRMGIPSTCGMSSFSKATLVSMSMHGKC